MSVYHQWKYSGAGGWFHTLSVWMGERTGNKWLWLCMWHSGELNGFALMSTHSDISCTCKRHRTRIRSPFGYGNKLVCFLSFSFLHIDHKHFPFVSALGDSSSPTSTFYDTYIHEAAHNISTQQISLVCQYVTWAIYFCTYCRFPCQFYSSTATFYSPYLSFPFKTCIWRRYFRLYASNCGFSLFGGWK